jgi:hypothetical protein
MKPPRALGRNMCSNVNVAYSGEEKGTSQVAKIRTLQRNEVWGTLRR